MRLDIRGKLFLVSVGIIATAVLVSGAYLEVNLRAWLTERTEQELHRQAQTAREVLGAQPSLQTIVEVDPLADRLGEASRARVTIIAEGGRVLGDSELSQSAVERVENHGRRAEVRSAVAAGFGTSERFSATLRTDMLYVAIPFEHASGRGVMRLATPLEDIDYAIGRLRVLLLVAGGAGLLLAIIMSGLASHFASRTMRRLVDRAHQVSLSHSAERPAVSNEVEPAFRLDSLNRVSDQLVRSVDLLAAERDRFQAVLEAMAESVIALDDQRRLSLINRAAEEMFGLTQEVVGRQFMDVFAQPDLIELAEEARDGEPTLVEIDLVHRDRRVLVQATPDVVSGGAVLVMHDVTQLRRLETIRRDFVANISHELRTPVSVIQANAETLLDGLLEADPDRARRFIEAVLRNSKRLADMVAGLLDIARLEADQYHLDYEALRLDGALQRAVNSVEASVMEKSIELTCHSDDSLWVEVDRNALDQVLLNLLENALKYTPKGGHIQVRSRGDRGSVRIEVEDNGVGIAPKHQPRVFERFYRVDPGRSRDHGGTGLGLAIVKHLIGAMGGRTGVESAQPSGSIFWVELPAIDSAASDEAFV